ncbi:hypothetical protein [Runella sp.]|uniref:hypothetical protein n=1 Tax=Runella sp. TaxID=1960881 RepID=UPI003015BF75
MKKIYDKKSILRKHSLCVSVFFSLTILQCYSQKVIRLSYEMLILPNSQVKKIEAICDNFFCIIGQRLIHFKIKNNSVSYAKSVVNDVVKDFIQNPENKDQLFLLTNKGILSLNTANMCVTTHCNLENIVEPKILTSITDFEIDKNSLWLLKENSFLKKIKLTDRQPTLIEEKPVPQEQEIFKIQFYKELKFIMTQKGLFKDNFKNLLCSGDKLVIKFSKLSFFFTFSSKGVICTARDYDIRFRDFHLQANSEDVRDVYHDNDNDLFWIAGSDLKVFSWDKGNLLLQLNNNSKPAFSSTQSKTICPIIGTKKILIGTEGSGIFLIEYEKKYSIPNPSQSIAYNKNIHTNQVPKPKLPIKNIFVLKNFEKDSTTLSPLDMIPFFRNINENIDFKQVEIKKVKIEGYASKTGKGSDETKTTEISQKRIKFIRQNLTEKYKLTDGFFEEHNYGDKTR